MKYTEKLRLMQNLDEKYVEEADEKIRFTSGRQVWTRGLAIAACAILVCGIAMMPFWNGMSSEESDRYNTEIYDNSSWITSDGHVICVYDNGEFDYVPFAFLAEKAMVDDNMMVMPEMGDVNMDNDVYLLNAFYYRPTLTYDRAYTYVYRKIKLDHIERKIGETKIKIGVNEETKEEIVCSAEMYAIRGIDSHYAIAVKPDAADPYVRSANLNGYLLWYRADVSFADFAALIEAYDLKNQFYVGPAFTEGLMTGTGIVENIIYPNEENRIFCEKLLAVNGNAVEHTFVKTDAAHLDIKCGFLVAGGEFGMKIYADGYLVTNIGGTLHTFDIGATTAAELIAYAKTIPSAYKGVDYYENGVNTNDGNSDGAMTLPYNPS